MAHGFFMIPQFLMAADAADIAARQDMHVHENFAHAYSRIKVEAHIRVIEVARQELLNLIAAVADRIDVHEKFCGCRRIINSNFAGAEHP